MWRRGLSLNNCSYLPVFQGFCRIHQVSAASCRSLVSATSFFFIQILAVDAFYVFQQCVLVKGGCLFCIVIALVFNILRNALVYLLQYVLYLFNQFLPVFDDALAPDEGVFVGARFNLCPVDVSFFEAQAAQVGKHYHHLGEKFAYGVFQASTPEIVNRAEIRHLHARKPHIVDVFFQLFFYFPARENIVHICEKYDFEHHFGVERACPAALISR